MKTTLVSSAAVCIVTALLSGCGLADVGAAAATEGQSAAEQAKEAKKIEAKVQKQIDDAQQAEKQARDTAEAASN
jgi:cell division protein FtsX